MTNANYVITDIGSMMIDGFHKVIFIGHFYENKQIIEFYYDYDRFHSYYLKHVKADANFDLIKYYASILKEEFRTRNLNLVELTFNMDELRTIVDCSHI